MAPSIYATTASSALCMMTSNKNTSSFSVSPTTANCDDLVAAAAATSEGNIVGQLNEVEITCDTWTTVEVAQNKFKLTGEEDGYTFTNVRFAVAADAVLRVEVPADFTGDTPQVR